MCSTAVERIYLCIFLHFFVFHFPLIFIREPENEGRINNLEEMSLFILWAHVRIRIVFLVRRKRKELDIWCLVLVARGFFERTQF